jgi:hypothetical protein
LIVCEIELDCPAAFDSVIWTVRVNAFRPAPFVENLIPCKNDRMAADVVRFFRTLCSRQVHSELAQAYRERLTKNRKKLFTFIRYGSVPWNNNNVKHAVNQYAQYREITDGQITELGLRAYSVLLTPRPKSPAYSVNQ